MADKFEKWIEFTPAYDKRNADPNKNYGVHGVDMRWYLRGENGAIQFVTSTNWFLPNVQREFDLKTATSPDIVSQLRTFHTPFATDIGYHSYVPRYEGQDPMGDCQVLHGKPCYYDGSGLQAEKFLKLLISEGHEAVWIAMEKEYEHRLALIDRAEKV